MPEVESAFGEVENLAVFSDGIMKKQKQRWDPAYNTSRLPVAIVHVEIFAREVFRLCELRLETSTGGGARGPPHLPQLYDPVGRVCQGNLTHVSTVVTVCAFLALGTMSLEPGLLGRADASHSEAKFLGHLGAHGPLQHTSGTM